MEHKYKIKYTTEQGEWTAEQLKELEAGGADKILICALTEIEGGRGLIAWFGRDGVTGEPHMKSQDAFQCWMALTSGLSKDQNLDEDLRKLLNALAERAQQFLNTRGK